MVNVNKVAENLVYMVGCVLTLGGLWITRCMITVAIRMSKE